VSDATPQRIKVVHRPCPQCGSADVHRSRTRTAAEWIARRLGLRLRRCHVCNFRFARLGNLVIPESAVRAVGQAFPVLALLSVLAVLSLVYR